MPNDKKSGLNATAAGIVGAVVGAGATAAAMGLSNKETREKMGKTMSDLRERGIKVYQQVRKRATKQLQKSRGDIRATTSQIRKKTSNLKSREK